MVLKAPLRKEEQQNTYHLAFQIEYLRNSIYSVHYQKVILIQVKWMRVEIVGNFYNLLKPDGTGLTIKGGRKW